MTDLVDRLRASIPDDAECAIVIYPGSNDGTMVRSFNMTPEQLACHLRTISDKILSDIELAKRASSLSAH